MAPVILYLILNKKISSRILRVVVFIVILSFCADALSDYLGSKRQSNSGVVNTYMLLETLGLLFYFYHILHRKLVKTSILVFGAFFTVYWIFSFLQIGLKALLEANNAMESIAIIVLSAYFFFQELLENESDPITKQRGFWVIIGFLLYTAGTFFLFLYFDTLDLDSQKKFLILNSIFTILKTISLSIAMCMKNNNKRRKFELS